MKPVRVLIVDDSATMRTTLTELLNSDERLEVVAVAADPYIAADILRQDRQPQSIKRQVRLLPVQRSDGMFGRNCF